MPEDGSIVVVGQDEVSAARRRLGALVRRIRRTADLSQRELADVLRVARSTVARAETGERDLPATVLARAAELAGLRLALVDGSGAEVPAMDGDAVRDRSDRHFPAHLDTRHGDVWWWHVSERYSRERPWYTFDRDRTQRDAWRAVDGTPPDHQLPRPGDSPVERAKARLDAAQERDAARRAELAEKWLRSGDRSGPDPVCHCPAGCDELLFSEVTLPARQHAVPHVDDCPCRCDVA